VQKESRRGETANSKKGKKKKRARYIQRGGRGQDRHERKNSQKSTVRSWGTRGGRHPGDRGKRKEANPPLLLRKAVKRGAAVQQWGDGNQKPEGEEGMKNPGCSKRSQKKTKKKGEKEGGKIGLEGRGGSVPQGLKKGERNRSEFGRGRLGTTKPHNGRHMGCPKQ